ncbi:myo-inositol 2-dehydrogenase/D-chiro-inositol 1-dehydrogenase [Actinoplanes lutulentus]|uniref:Inositol 2-dehydrogenase n=1 Tax=Actinoplanes lutulentus TaxID=1287878 RepID=A0A327Z747_9ACTN|nr:Gfo/Idh/MocA family oxidoreductase [Actinoplanes lutulentus]MBB2947015.1 myo-inositol 2-dehydrogenase/D-chiro-inositol 1-dehydrogenase [Actinoplanes lutulentus]RAK30514.1 myo-inositol 2-dehydrogenase [Actinoplanes lutulentus]
MLRVGVIGTGMIGQDHIRRLTSVLSGARVVAVTDVDTTLAAGVGAAVGAAVHPTGEDVIAACDAVLVCSWGPSHEQYVLAAIDAGKPVFCEKPLATTASACRRIVDAEVACGRRLVQVGFMRRFDDAYRKLRNEAGGGAIGAPLLMHCAHRNRDVPAYYRTEMAIVDTAVHEFDMVRWMFGEDIVAIRVLVPRSNRNGAGLQDPLLIILELANGIIVDVETSVNIRYGYDIRGEIVGENGTLTLGGPVAVDWRDRFQAAYDTELQEWIDALGVSGHPTGPSAWDGYAATAVCEAGVQSLRTGSRVEVALAERPSLFLS